MKFQELTEKEFKTFADNHEQGSFFQTVEIANLRKSYGSTIHFLGIKKGKNVVAATMFSETKTLFGKSNFYAPRGYLVDYHNKELLAFFTDELKKYCKGKNGMMIKIDPNVIYQIRNNDGSIDVNGYKDSESIDNLKSLGYRHYGFNTDFEYTQSRWNFRVPLDIEYEELKKGFSKSTRKNIDATYKKGVRVRRGTKEDLESMEEILIKTAQRKNFQYRSLEYYTRMYNYLGDKMRIYLTYLDADVYLESSLSLLKEEKANNKKIEEKMLKDMVGNKLKNQKDTSDKLIKKYEEEVKIAEEFKKVNPNGKDIGVLISLKSGLEYLTLYSGILMEYKKFTPKYAMYNEHILDAYKDKIPYANFYGISGIFDASDKHYGMYEFKRGFGGNVIELIGEFTYPLSFTYYLYMALRKLNISIKKIKNK